jgi:hypothetical protein
VLKNKGRNFLFQYLIGFVLVLVTLFITACASDSRPLDLEIVEAGNPPVPVKPKPRLVRGRVSINDIRTCEQYEALSSDGGAVRKKAELKLEDPHDESGERSCAFEFELATGKVWDLVITDARGSLNAAFFFVDPLRVSRFYFLADASAPLDLGELKLTREGWRAEREPATMNDADGDSLVDYEDTDDDNDGIPDVDEADCNKNNIPDDVELTEALGICPDFLAY